MRARLPQGRPRLRRDFNEVQHLKVSRKWARRTLSSIADKRAEDTLIEELQKGAARTGDSSSRSAARSSAIPTSRAGSSIRSDGTSNFLHGIPHFCISIAVEDPNGAQGKPEVTHGYIYQPLTDESFWSEKGRGALVAGPAPARSRRAATSTRR